MKTTGKTTATTLRATAAKNAKHVEEFSSSEQVVEREEEKLLRVEEDSKVIRGNSLVRRGKICKLSSD